jgi:hypothetical protein
MLWLTEYRRPPVGHAGQRKRVAKRVAMIRLSQSDYSLLRLWAVLIAATLIIFWVSRGTQYQQLAIGLLSASVSLCVALSLFEFLLHSLGIKMES